MMPRTKFPHTTDQHAFSEKRGQHPCKRVLIWCLAPFVDSWTGLSLNRFLAILFAVAATHGRFAHDAPLTAADVTLATLAGSLAFGKDIFMGFLNRNKEVVV